MKELVDIASSRYRAIGRFAEGMARGKMGADPVYAEVLGLVAAELPAAELPASGLLLDAGCGEGYLLALVRAAHPGLALVGIDHDTQRLDLAARVFVHDTQVELVAQDLCQADLPGARLIACLDVLHYLPPPAQDALIARLAQALDPGGLLVIRDAESEAGWRSILTEGSERLSTALGRHKGQGVYLRARQETVSALEQAGLSVQARSCSQGTPFANVLFLARRAAEGAG